MHDPQPDTPQRLLIGSRAELASALMQLISRARRQLRFAAADLSVLALGDAQPVAGLRQLLLARADNRIRLLVDDMAWLDRAAPRLRQLQRAFSHALLIRCTDPQDRLGDDVAAIGDDADALRLQPTVAIRGELWCQNAAFSRPLIAAFERRWEHAAHDQPSQPLGL